MRRSYLTLMNDFKYTSNRIYPALDEAAKKRRMKWAKAFWIFWQSAKIMSNKIKILYSQMDEKWFFAVVTRRNNKNIASLGVAPALQHVHHKSHIHKVMGICVTAAI